MTPLSVSLKFKAAFRSSGYNNHIMLFSDSNSIFFSLLPKFPASAFTFSHKPFFTYTHITILKKRKGKKKS